MPLEAIQQRMAQGRFRVKGNVDVDTARRFAADLERLGAVCTIVDATSGQPLSAASAGPAASLAGAAPPSTPTVDSSPLAGATPSSKPAVDASPLAGAAPKVSAAAELETGLALAGRESHQDLGVLASDAGLSLATLDGSSDDTGRPAGAAGGFAADDAAFAPPEEEAKIELAVELHTPAPELIKPAPAPEAEPEAEFLTFVDEPAPATAAAPATARAASAAMPAARPPRPAGESPVARARAYLADNPRHGLVAGVLLALLLGFVPAHFLASVREGSAYAEIRKEVRTEYAAATNVERWEALDEYLLGQRELMDSKRQNIAVSSVLVWLVCAGGLGFAWHRTVLR